MCLSSHDSACTTIAATAHNGGSTMPNSASGVITSVTSGIAIRLAAKPTSETCWKKTIDSGASPMVARACVRRPLRAAMRMRSRQPAGGAAASSRDTGSATINKPTATNDNQKPGCNIAHGSSAVTTTAAANSTNDAGQHTPIVRSSATAASIHTVRCAGTPQPASSA